jgi:hypothetical protein
MVELIIIAVWNSAVSCVLIFEVGMTVFNQNKVYKLYEESIQERPLIIQPHKNLAQPKSIRAPNQPQTAAPPHSQHSPNKQQAHSTTVTNPITVVIIIIVMPIGIIALRKDKKRLPAS